MEWKEEAEAGWEVNKSVAIRMPPKNINMLLFSSYLWESPTCLCSLCIVNLNLHPA